MSKKKRHYQKSRNRKGSACGRNDTHHIFFPRNIYKGGYLYELRNHWYCRAFIPKDTLHKEIHCKISCVPVPRPFIVKEVLIHLGYLEKYHGISEEDSLEKRLLVLASLFECVENLTTDALKKQLEIAKQYKPS